ncbi:hypothetical protein [Agaribacterium haliotis]|uniref:hypothetical protein n=1 Tax=Agaribacterium haliotis TaxID=2013869 RepID=UPI001177DD4F|nr:hypothetical protein [Agaribacterium haliotis]
MTEYVVLGLLSLLIALNAFSSYRAVTSDYFDKKQKTAQLVTIWLIPLLGALLILSVTGTPSGSKNFAHPDGSQSHSAELMSLKHSNFGNSSSDDN